MFDSVMQWFGLGGDLSAFWGGWGAQLAKIIWIDILLSGDNAVVIALACRGLPAHQRKWGILLGATAAILMRVAFAVVATQLLQYKWLMLIGSLLLFWIALKLMSDDHDSSNIAESGSIWGALRTVVIADVVMSLDNVVAIAAVAKGDWSLIILGLIISMPLIIYGAQFVMWLLQRAPILIVAGAALLGWLAGELIVADPGVIGVLKQYTSLPLEPANNGIAGALAVPAWLKYSAATAGALFVILAGMIMRRKPAAAH